MTKTPRFEVRFSNGAWKTFDTVTYSSWDTHRTLAEATEAVSRINKAKAFK